MNRDELIMREVQRTGIDFFSNPKRTWEPRKLWINKIAIALDAFGLRVNTCAKC